MLQSIWDDVRREFNYGNMVTRIIIVNVSFYVLINLIWIILRLTHAWETPAIYDTIVDYLSLSSELKFNLLHPWVIFTHMFFHVGFWHILWNMLFMYWFGRIVGDFIGNQRVLPIYLLGGLAGAIVFFFSAKILPNSPNTIFNAYGASAAVMAIVTAAGAISPDYIMRLLFLGDVKLKWIVFVLVFIDLMGIAGDVNTGGHFAHLGGALFGWVFVRQLRDGNDWSIPVNNILNRIISFFTGLKTSPQKRRRPHVVYKNPNRTAGSRPKKKSKRGSGESASDDIDLTHQEQLDAILDKIKQSGYDSLSEAEKEFLFNASKK